MRETLDDLRKSAVYAGLQAWRTRGFWLRALLSFVVGAAVLLLDESNDFDLRFEIRGSQQPDRRVVIIDITERDWNALQDDSTRNMIRPMKEIMNFSDGWYWNPALWETLLGSVLMHEPAAVGVALYFDHELRPSQFSDRQRQIFLDPRITWGADLDSNGRALVPDFATTYSAHAATKHLRTDDDGIVRRFSSSMVQVPAMPLKLAEISGYGEAPKRFDQQQRWQAPQLINFMGPAETFTTFNVRDIIEGRIPGEALRGKIVLIGSSTSPIDQMQTPLGRMSRTEVLANITDNVLGDKTVARAPDGVYLFGLSLLLAFSVFILTSYPQTVALMLFLWTGTLLAALSAWTFDSFYVWIPVASPLAMLSFTYIIFLSYQLAINEQKTWKLEQERRYLLEIEQLKNNFVSMMSHDLKTPIAKIQGIVDRLLMQAPQEIAQDLKSLRRSSDDLHRYIQSILQVTKVEAKDFRITKEVIDINEQIEKAVSRVSALAMEKCIRLETKLEPMFSIEADSTLIHEVILNLVENAIKYTPNGGSVTVTSHESDDNVHVIVEDTGVGIPPEDQDVVWGKFTRGRNFNPDVKGTGLGLYLVKYFIELHGGRVSLESSPGSGTKIGFRIPVTSDGAEISEPQPEAFGGPNVPPTSFSRADLWTKGARE